MLEVHLWSHSQSSSFQSQGHRQGKLYVPCSWLPQALVMSRKKKLSFLPVKGMHGFITTDNEKVANKKMQRMANVSITPSNLCISITRKKLLVTCV